MRKLIKDEKEKSILNISTGIRISNYTQTLNWKKTLENWKLQPLEQPLSKTIPIASVCIFSIESV